MAALQYLAQKGVNLFERDFRGSTSLDAAAKQRGGQQGPNNATLEFLHDVLRVGGAAASQAWAKHERRERRLPVVILRALVVRGRAVAQTDSSWTCRAGRCASCRSQMNASRRRDDEADDRKGRGARATGPFRHVVVPLDVSSTAPTRVDGVDVAIDRDLKFLQTPNRMPRAHRVARNTSSRAPKPKPRPGTAAGERPRRLNVPSSSGSSSPR